MVQIIFHLEGFLLTFNFLFQISSFLPEDLSLAPGLQSLNLKGKDLYRPTNDIFNFKPLKYILIF